MEDLPRFKRDDFASLPEHQRIRGYETRPLASHPLFTKSYKNPLGYFEALHILLRERGFESQSVIDERYALYTDLVRLKSRKNKIARWDFDEEEGWRSESYDMIARKVELLAKKWSAAGIVAGTHVCLYAKLDQHWLVGLLTILKLGAVGSWLPMEGPTFVRNRLNKLGPDFIAAHAHHHPDLDVECVDFRLESVEELPFVQTHTYEPKETALKLLSPFAKDRDQPVELPAGDLYHRLLTDVVVVFELTPTDRVATLGLNDLQHHPWLPLVTMLAGGTYIQSSGRTTETPQALSSFAELRPTVVGLDDRSRHRLSPHLQTIAQSLRLWFRDISEPLDWQGWERFQEKFGKEECWGINVLVNAAFGGVLMFSPRSNKVPLINVTPAPGVPWKLLDQSGPGHSRRRSIGLYSKEEAEEDDPSIGQLLLSQDRPTEVYFIGTRWGVQGARTYPALEVVEVVRTLPEVSDCRVIYLDRFMDSPQTPVKLLVFLNHGTRKGFSTQEQSTLQTRIVDRIRQELSAEFIPAEVGFSHSFPEHDDAYVLDTSWCDGQYYRGMLTIKEDIEVFSSISALRTLIRDVPES